jgi:pimeloyl-ACP methyl ester carboxylesterase
MAEYIKKCPKINKDRVFVIGRSLGSAVAINLLSKEHGLFKGAILENTFTTLAEMAENFFVLFKMLPVLKNALTAKWNNLQLMQQLSVPVLFVFGD